MCKHSFYLIKKIKLIKKRNLVLPVIIFLIAYIIGVFELTPLNRSFTQIVLIFSTVGYFVFLLYYKFFPKKFKFWYILGIFFMFLSILMQNIINGQSFVSGFVANFRFYNIGVLALIFYWFIKYKISLRHLIRGLITAGWINLIVIVLMYVTDYSFINESELTGIVVVTHAGIMKKSLVDLVGIIYLVFFFKSDKYKYLIFAILFFSIHHIYELQRFALLNQIFLFYVAFRKIYNFKAKLKFFAPAVLAIFLVNFYLFDFWQLL